MLKVLFSHLFIPSPKMKHKVKLMFINKEKKQIYLHLKDEIFILLEASSFHLWIKNKRWKAKRVGIETLFMGREKGSKQALVCELEEDLAEFWNQSQLQREGIEIENSIII